MPLLRLMTSAFVCGYIMKNSISFAHLNIVARDWRSLARFYQEVFGCIPASDERNLSGLWLDAATRVKLFLSICVILKVILLNFRNGIRFYF
jgi:hypothetical protein